MNETKNSLVVAAFTSIAAVSPIFMPAPQPMKWLLFAILLSMAVFICHQYLSAGLAGLTVALPLGAAAYGVWVAVHNPLHLAVVSVAAAVVLSLGVISFFLGSRVRIRSGPSGPSEVFFKKPKNLHLTTGEVIMGRRKVAVKAFPTPRFTEPSWQPDFRVIAGMDEFKKKLRAAAFECVGPEDRNGILLHGEPGNGKTVFAQAIAGELGLEFFTIKQRKMKWVGEESINLFNQFNEAASRAPCVIFFDEADSIFRSRSNYSVGSDSAESTSILNRFLQDLVKYRASGVVFIAATNYIDAIDPAIRRPGRFDFVFEVPNPDLAAREGLLHVGIKKTGLSIAVPDTVIKSLGL